jgi:DNA-binding beta-propeller fold protein YncE
MKKALVICVVGLIGCAALALAGAQQAPSPAPAKAAPREISSLQLQQEIPVPNVMGRLDHMSSDSKRRLLFVSALGNNSAEVIDTFGGRVVHTITEGLSQPQGILYVPDFNKIVIANAENGKVNIYDGTTYQLRKSLDFSPDPDNIRWDAATKLVVLGYGEDDGGIAFIDPQKEEQVGQVLKTGGHPESFQVEQTGGIFT